MNFEELNELDLSNVGDWPLAIKLIIVLLLCGLVAAGGYFGLITDQEDQLARVQREEQDLRQEFENKQDRAANLENYKKQLALMEESFGAMRRQLPDSTEVPDLLVDVSQTGLAAGLEFELFQPQAEVPKEFYAELPIKLRVKGDYHEFGEFVSGLAALPRIVTIHNVAIKPVGRTADGDAELVMEATAKTYRYLDEGGK